MIKILHNASCWLPLTQTWMYTQLKYLPEGFRAQVACQVTENLDQFGDVEAIYCLQERVSPLGYLMRRALRKAGLRRSLCWLKKPILVFKPDIIHSHFGNIGWSALPEITNGIPHVVTFYGYDLSGLPGGDPRWNARYKELFDKVSRVFCEGPHMAECIQKLGCIQEKIHVQRLGIRLDHIPYKPREWDGTEPLRVLLAGTFTEKKGLPYALAALGRLAKEVRLEVTVIGDARESEADQAEKKKILRAIEEGGLSDKVTLLGYQTHSAFFDEAYKHHIFLSPSVTAESGDTEGGAPVTIIEMAATGMPVISTKHCDIPGVILDGQTGLLADERDVDGLYGRLLWLAENPGKWRRMLDKGREHLEANFDARKQGLKLAEKYAQLIKEGF
ncbi:MAG: glycosyltransferase [Desulfobacteraceae bacterium]|nr:glycosyltransferase [Desulfobacteraceae bacterium]